MQKLRVAIVGGGSISRVHSEAVRNSGLADIVCLVENNPEKAEALSLENTIPVINDYKKILNRDDIDTVHITTPHYNHYEIALDFIRHGKNLLIEKPLTLSVKEAENLVEESEKNGVFSAIVYQNRLNKTSAYMKKLLEEKKYGEILGVKGILAWCRDSGYYLGSDWKGTIEKEGGGVLINQAIHTLDLMLWFGGDIETVRGSAHKNRTTNEIEVEDTVEAYMVFKNGAKGVFYATNNYSYDSGVELEVHCENGILNIKNNRLKLFLDNDEILLEEENFTKNEFNKKCYGNSHETLIKNFYESILENTKNYIDIKEGIKALKVIEKIYKKEEKTW
jgi:UDP-N-acetyl-2-amino-2-deoxyglucuronate dehydrogenase